MCFHEGNHDLIHTLALIPLLMGLYAGRVTGHLHLFFPGPNSLDMCFLCFPKIMDSFKPRTTFSMSSLWKGILWNKLLWLAGSLLAQ